MMRSTVRADPALAAVRAAAHPLPGNEHDHDALLDLVGDAPLVLLGEASHGTHEFYRERARITRRLIVEKQFTAVAVEGDWPDAYRVNRFVRGRGGGLGPDDQDADAALAGFQRFPIWMWRNTVVAAFVDWLRGHNARLPAAEQCGFYGLDLYSLRLHRRGAGTAGPHRPRGRAARPRTLRLLRPLRPRQPGLRPDDRPARRR